MVEMRTSTCALRTFTLKRRPGAGLLRDVQAGHDLQAQHQGRGDLRVGLGLDVQHAVDAEADDEARLLGLDVDVGSAHPHGILEHALQQAHHRRVLDRSGDAQGAEVHRGRAELLAQLLGQPGDLLVRR
jgi:hypothetical protein